MAKMANFKKNDLFLALAIGFSSALMLIFVGRNLSEENKFFEKLMPYANWLFLIFPLVCGGGIVATHFAAKIAGHALSNSGNFFWSADLIFCLTPPFLIFSFLPPSWRRAGLKPVLKARLSSGASSAVICGINIGLFQAVPKKTEAKKFISFWR